MNDTSKILAIYWDNLPFSLFSRKKKKKQNSLGTVMGCSVWTGVASGLADSLALNSKASQSNTVMGDVQRANGKRLSWSVAWTVPPGQGSRFQAPPKHRRNCLCLPNSLPRYPSHRGSNQHPTPHALCDFWQVTSPCVGLVPLPHNGDTIISLQSFCEE